MSEPAKCSFHPKPGDRVLIRIAGQPVKAKVLRQSQATGELIVEVTEAFRAYSVGSTVQVKLWECEPPPA